MRHVGAAIAEMFSTGHVRMLREASRLERLLLAAIYIETTSRCGWWGQRQRAGLRGQTAGLWGRELACGTA